MGKGNNTGGKGPQRNPLDSDGEPLKCSTCGSTEHLRARCPQCGGKSGKGIFVVDLEVIMFPFGTMTLTDGLSMEVGRCCK